MALIDNDADLLHHRMKGFWRSLCEVKIMPLTTEYFPDTSHRVFYDKYNKDIYNLDKENDETINENLGLRLTQNFQIVNPFGTCELDQFSNQSREYFKMSLRNRYAIC